MIETKRQKLKYQLYCFICWLFGHEHSCCPDIRKRCSKCECVIAEKGADNERKPVEMDRSV